MPRFMSSDLCVAIGLITVSIASIPVLALHLATLVAIPEILGPIASIAPEGREVPTDRHAKFGRGVIGARKLMEEPCSRHTADDRLAYIDFANVVDYARLVCLLCGADYVEYRRAKSLFSKPNPNIMISVFFLK